MDIHEKLRLAKLQFIIRTELRVFGCILHKFNFQFTTDKKYSTAAVTIIKKIPTIILNETFIDSCNIKQIIFVILHEMMHVINNHMIASFSIDINNIFPKIANIAQDHCLNKMIDADSRNGLKDLVESPNVNYILFKEIITKNWIWEEVYQWLLNKQETFKISLSEDGTKITINGKEYDLDIIKSDESSSDDSEVAEQISKDLKATIRSVIDNNIGNIKGHTNSELFEYLNKITKIELPWDKILERVITRHVVPSMENRSWKTYNKFLRAYAILPSFDTEPVYNTMYAIIDTSGSVESKDLKKFAGVIKNSLTLFKQIRIIQHSYNITFNKLYSSEEIMQDENLLLSVYGRGGTSHTECFDFIENNYEEDSVEFIIFLTDFESNIERLWPNYEWVNNIPCKFVLNQNNVVPHHIDNSPILIDKYLEK